MSARPWVLAELTHDAVRSVKWEAAVLPFGATEAHNLHMPYGTDTYQVEAIVDRACQRATAAGAKVLRLPAMPFGVNTNHLEVPGGVALSVCPSTLMKLLADLVEALERQGIKKLLLVNGHGANELKPHLRELHHRTGVFLCLCDWFRMAGDVLPKIFERKGEHADEMETSLGLAFFPEFMGDLAKADDGAAAPTKLEAINKGWISITRPWHLVSKNTGLGDPHQATAEKGRALMDVVSTRLGDFLVELCRQPMSDTFPY
jgi:creatinine amidohydrolase